MDLRTTAARLLRGIWIESDSWSAPAWLYCG